MHSYTIKNKKTKHKQILLHYLTGTGNCYIYRKLPTTTVATEKEILNGFNIWMLRNQSNYRAVFYYKVPQQYDFITYEFTNVITLNVTTIDKKQLILSLPLSHIHTQV